MNKQEQKRFDKLRDEVEKEALSSGLDKFTYPDLFLMLREDKHLRKLIRAIVKGSKDETQEETPPPPEAGEAPTEINADDTPEIKAITEAQETDIPASDPLHDSLSPELQLLEQVLADTEIAADWFGESTEDKGRQLVRLIARAAQWDSILDLWDRLAARCKTRRGSALPAERSMLDGCLKTHNLLWRSRQARLSHAAIGSSYDHRQHQRGTPIGETITAEWLPGLINAGGVTQKTPLVETR